jgi:hypothetical protein
VCDEMLFGKCHADDVAKAYNFSAFRSSL